MINITRRKLLSGMMACATAPSRGHARPEDFGAFGDGRMDDQAALAQLSNWLNAGPGRRATLSGQYRVGRRLHPLRSNWAEEGAITVRRPKDVSVVFTAKAELLMDNLDLDGVGDQFHGIFVEGPGSGIFLENPTIKWVRKASIRSQGDGIRLHGYPKENAALHNICIRNSLVAGAPQAGMILIGCSDVDIDCHASIDTLADGFHVNSSRRVPRWQYLWNQHWR